MNGFTSTDNPDLYEQPIHWDREFGSFFWEKKRVFRALIGRGTRAILDVGCGDRKITNDLSPDRFVVGCDRSKTALERVQVPKVRASCEALPFDDQAFDLVLCSEVLEHLPENVYTRTISELSRVAAKTIIISVPYAESLAALTTQCAACGAEYNLDGHLRSFHSPKQIALDFREFRLTFVAFCGRRDERVPGWLTHLRHFLLGKWPSSQIAMCPVCGCTRTKNNTRERPFLRWVLDRLKWRLASEPLHRWLVLKFERADTADESLR